MRTPLALALEQFPFCTYALQGSGGGGVRAQAVARHPQPSAPELRRTAQTESTYKHKVSRKKGKEGGGGGFAHNS
jgi:hypothetical protein